MTYKIAPLILAATLASPLSAQDFTSQIVDEHIEDVTFYLEDAILNAGLTIDFVSHTGDMLSRTREDVGSDIELFTDATLFNFCSARISRQVMEADITNIAYCPYAIFVYATPDNPDQTVIGHRVYPGASMQPANDLLDSIISEAIE